MENKVKTVSFNLNMLPKAEKSAKREIKQKLDRYREITQKLKNKKKISQKDGKFFIELTPIIKQTGELRKKIFENLISDNSKNYLDQNPVYLALLDEIFCASKNVIDIIKSVSPELNENGWHFEEQSIQGSPKLIRSLKGPLDSDSDQIKGAIDYGIDLAKKTHKVKFPYAISDIQITE